MNFLGKIPILKEFERFEWFEWFEWLGPSPTEPFNSASNAFVLRVAQEHEAPGLRHVEQLENSFDRIECVVEGVPHMRNVEIVPRETRVPGGSVRGERANFTGLVLGCIEAKFCK